MCIMHVDVYSHFCCVKVRLTQAYGTHTVPPERSSTAVMPKGSAMFEQTRPTWLSLHVTPAVTVTPPPTAAFHAGRAAVV